MSWIFDDIYTPWPGRCTRHKSIPVDDPITPTSRPLASCTRPYTCYPQSMTKTAKTAPTPQAQEPDDDGAIALVKVAFRHQDDNLQTQGLAVGERLSNGRYTGAIVQAMYATPVGIIVELAFADGKPLATVLHTGDTDAVLA